MILNESQKAAAEHLKGPMLVSAGPGSGKTAVIVRRIVYLIEKHHADPSKILTVTFTKAAAAEMSERFSLITNNRYPAPLFGTFHSVFLSMLKSYGRNGLRIITGPEKHRLIKSLILKNNIDTYDIDILLTDMINDISRFKNHPEGFSPTAVNNELFYKMFHDYSVLLDSKGLIDFDDILLHFLKLISDDPDALYHWQHRFKYILIDEFQDINALQYEIIKKISLPENNIFAVGDDDQNIYAFRGALKNAGSIFLKDYQNAEHIMLNINYRSRQEIIYKSGQLIDNTPGRTHRDIKCFNPAGEGKVSAIIYEDQKDQYEDIAVRIKELISTGIPGSRIAVLNRGNRYIPGIIKVLADNSVSAVCPSGKTSIYDHFIFKDILAYMRAAAGLNDRSDLLRIRSISPGISPEKSGEGLKFLERLSPKAGIEYILNVLNYKEFIKEYSLTHSHSSEDLFNKLNTVKDLASSFYSPLQFADHIESEIEKSNLKDTTSIEGSVNIITMHASKGLEFDAVFIPDLNKGIIPSGQGTDPEIVSEERRLLYVAMTRAKDLLFLSCSRRILGKKVNPSVFFSELFHV